MSSTFRSIVLQIACAVSLFFGSLMVGTSAQTPTNAPVATLHFPKNAKQTAGVSLTLDEVSRERGGRHGTKIAYRVTTSGFPSGKTYARTNQALSCPAA